MATRTHHLMLTLTNFPQNMSVVLVIYQAWLQHGERDSHMLDYSLKVINGALFVWCLIIMRYGCSFERAH